MTKKELEALKHAVQEQWGTALFKQDWADGRGNFTSSSHTPEEKRATAEHYKLLALGGKMLAERFLDAVRKTGSVCENINLISSWVEEKEMDNGRKLRPQAKIEVIDDEKR